jgi:putative Mg2+ transporter-C (MgtC) family protein
MAASPIPCGFIQGLAQAIGFIAAGAIFVSKGQVRNLTTAANVWLTTAVGIAAGAGQFVLVGVTVGFGVIVVTLVRVLEHYGLGKPLLDDEHDK